MDVTGTLEGRGALVAGGASGRGRPTCLALAEAGGHVAVADIDAPGERADPDAGHRRRTLLLLHPAAYVPEMQIVPRLEPNFPR